MLVKFSLSEKSRSTPSSWGSFTLQSNHLEQMRRFSCVSADTNWPFPHCIGFASNVVVYHSSETPLWHTKLSSNTPHCTSGDFIDNVLKMWYKFQCLLSVWVFWMFCFFFSLMLGNHLPSHASNSNWTLCVNDLAAFRKFPISKSAWFACIATRTACLLIPCVRHDVLKGLLEKAKWYTKWFEGFVN